MNKICLLICGALLVPALTWAGCTSKTQRSPSLTEQPSVAPRKGFLESAGDTTWNVVTTPARLVSGVGAKKPASKEPEIYEPATAVIVDSNGTGNGSNDTQSQVAPATTQPSQP